MILVLRVKEIAEDKTKVMENCCGSRLDCRINTFGAFLGHFPLS